MSKDSLNREPSFSLRTRILDVVGRHTGWEESAEAMTDDIMAVLRSLGLGDAKPKEEAKEHGVEVLGAAPIHALISGDSHD